MPDQWVELTSGKQFSRILYTNPVCFLATTSKNNGEKNVMVISWLSAANNDGRFLVSLNRRRHSASVLDEKFSLSVPVSGMEDLVRNVGSTSGSRGSKFPSDYPADSAITDTSEKEETLSNRKRKKSPRFPKGIPGLEILDTSTNGTSVFIHGTVAQLECEVHQILADVIDDQHYLVIADVKKARVHRDYWDTTKNLFRTGQGLPPYLAFFGSQQFGYTVASPTSHDDKTG